MKTRKAAAAAQEDDDDEPRKVRSSRHRRRRSRSPSSSTSQSPPRKRSNKHGKRKKKKKTKVTRHRRRSLTPTRRSPSSSSSSASRRSVSPPPRGRSRDVRRKKERWRGRERDRRRRKARRSTSSSTASPSSGSSRSRGRGKRKSRKPRAAGSTEDGATRDKVETDRPCSRSDRTMDVDDDVTRDDEAPTTIANKKNLDLEETECQPSENANETQSTTLPDGGGADSDAEDLELVLRKKALDNFRKFRAAATIPGKADKLTAGKEASADSPLNASINNAEATRFQRHGSGLGVRHPAGSPPRPEDCENGAGRYWKQEISGAWPAGILEAGNAGVPTQHEGRTAEGTHSDSSQFMSQQDDRSSRSVMQRLVMVSTLGSSASVTQRLGTNAGVSHVSGAPRIRSVVSIPSREGLDGSTHTTASVESGSEVGLPQLVDVNKAEGTNGEIRKTSEASASNGSILSPAEDKSQARIEDKDGFQKKTFSRMHDGETVEVSYKVYIPKKTPALARRKLQR